MMLASYATYTVCRALGVDPLIALIPAALVTALFGGVVFQLTIRRALKAPERTSSFSLSVWPSLSARLSISYLLPRLQVVSRILIDVARYRRSSFGRMVLCVCRSAVIYAVGLQMFLTKTRTARRLWRSVRTRRVQPSSALMSIGHTGLCLRWPLDWSVAMGALFLTKSAIFPGRWSPLHHEKFQLVAMAGIGNIPEFSARVPARLAENFLRSFRARGIGGDCVFRADHRRGHPVALSEREKIMNRHWCAFFLYSSRWPRWRFPRLQAITRTGRPQYHAVHGARHQLGHASWSGQISFGIADCSV